MRTKSGTKVASRAASISHPQTSGSREGRPDDSTGPESRGRTIDIASTHLRLSGPGRGQPVRGPRTGGVGEWSGWDNPLDPFAHRGRGTGWKGPRGFSAPAAARRLRLGRPPT